MSNAKETMLEGLKKLVRNEIRVEISKPGAPLSVCACRVGGKPAVPSDFTWPLFLDEENERKPLTFMAQFNLKDVAPLDKENLLPKTGVLSFFLALDTIFENKDDYRVFYFPDDAALKIAEFPDDLDEENRIPEFAVDFKTAESVPYWEDAWSSDKEAYDDYELYDECRVELGFEPEGESEITTTKLLGYPELVQGSMMDEDGVLLFQMAPIEEGDYELMIGDCGVFYFWISKEDLKNGVFDNTQLEYQCC